MREHGTRSLKHEYEIYVEREIEDYKDSIPRSVLLGIGDDAVAALRSQEQVAFDELLLWAEVDRIIFKRLRLPSYSTWRRRRLKLLAEYKRPEHWGLDADAPLVRAIQRGAEAQVLVAGEQAESQALFLAANGCTVTAVEPEPDIVERVVSAAERVGLASRVSGHVAGLDGWSPATPLAAVVCTAAAFAGLNSTDRARVIDLLQTATLDGGVHLVETIVAGQTALTVDELSARYHGWAISVERGTGSSQTFLARKGIS